MFSKSSKYAIKAVLYLAVNSSIDKKIMAKEIAEPINVPKAYIAKLLQDLAKHNIISSTKGPRGGFYLSSSNKKHSVMRIIEVIDGKEKFNSCMLSLNKCDLLKPCPLHKAIFPIKTQLIESLNSKTIDMLSNDVKLGKAFLPL